MRGTMKVLRSDPYCEFKEGGLIAAPVFSQLRYREDCLHITYYYYYCARIVFWKKFIEAREEKKNDAINAARHTFWRYLGAA